MGWLSDISIQITAANVAWYAAIVSTVGLGMSAFVIWRDRPRLKVMAVTDMVIMPSRDKKLYIRVTAANTGRRSMKLNNAVLHDKKTKVHYVSTSQWTPSPILGEGHDATVFFDQSQVDLDSIDYAVVYDATGKRWRAKLTRLKGKFVD